jgi:hypothetical protein
MEVVVPDQVTKIADSTFQNCSSLSAVTLGAELTEIGAQAFRGCLALSSIIIPLSVSIIGNNAFRGCNTLLIKAVATEAGPLWSSSYNPDRRPVQWGYEG